MINKFDYTFGVVLFILVWDLRAYYKNVLQGNLTRKQQEWVNNMRYPQLYKFYKFSKYSGWNCFFNILYFL